jgi:cytidyltransferase-like protein
MLHPGHLGLFQWCAHIAREGEVTVAVNTDEFVTQFKRRPTNSLAERMAMVSAIRGVDNVIENDGKHQRGLIARLNPDIIVVGSDWARKDYLAQIDVTQDWLDQTNIALAYVPRTGDWSSTEIRGRLTDAVHRSS